MKNPHPYSDAVRAYLHRLGNPYASLQVRDDPENDEHEVPNNASRLYHLLENPYATLSMGKEAEKPRETSPESTNSSSVKAPRGSLSKADFCARSSRIFKQYIPAPEKGRLRAHHRDFITRNESCSSTRRYRLVKQLEKFDLSNIEGIKTRFNRERELFTDEKLKQIERLVDSED